MLRAIFIKEFFKIRWLWLTLMLLNGLLMTYVYIVTRQLFILDHAEIVWYRVIHLGQIHYAGMKYAFMLTGLLVACIQYLPEMAGERLRLSLHLPVSPHRLIMAHVFVGLAALGLVVALDLGALALITRNYFPAEAVVNTLLTALPWGFAGLAAFLGATLEILEPCYRLKLFNLGITAGVIGFFLYPVEQAGYNYALRFLWVPILLMIPAVLLPAYRFRFRRIT